MAAAPQSVSRIGEVLPPGRPEPSGHDPAMWGRTSLAHGTRLS